MDSRPLSPSGRQLLRRLEQCSGGSLGDTQILPKKTYVEKHQGLPVRISTSFQLRELMLVGSWDDWQEELPMRKAFNPLRGCEEKYFLLMKFRRPRLASQPHLRVQAQAWQPIPGG